MWLVLVVWGFKSEVGDVWWPWSSGGGGGGVCSVFREKTRFSGGGGVCSVKWVMYVYLYFFLNKWN
ncbi:hypothetical protein HanXRQr2_Chr06g0247971 [Helianthus annuus]|uniref:Transmembrane protein n=1 Tax=Helianthus annuus TaxID=4232 RepID=A0A9K3IRC3_HELAN|nr:hypothetical protein HanXRQr2_Chr06g0247971 [Helianthus annuus]KAJ0559727.1 hypothetical protein HanHA300_Chr06g0203611 [Helianthus annuus]KAJ0565808.1 hypothetical protein HanIR_Chr06g0266771 [Helianthus annuus]KAJ0572710.1 hypothetical protein HanHA89_Chr06g0218741 [Helianthus annuus]